MLTLDENHIYRDDGKVAASVTQILDAGGMISDFCKQSFAAQRGTAIHEACTLLSRNKLDMSTVDERIMGYVLSYWQFLSGSGLKILAVETQVYDPILRVAGTYDVLFQGWLVDLKSGAPAKWHALQTAAYHALSGLNFRTKRGTLYLSPKGKTARLVEHKDRTDLPEFLTLVEKYYDRNRD